MIRETKGIVTWKQIGKTKSRKGTFTLDGCTVEMYVVHEAGFGGNTKFRIDVLADGEQKYRSWIRVYDEDKNRRDAMHVATTQGLRYV